MSILLPKKCLIALPDFERITDDAQFWDSSYYRISSPSDAKVSVFDRSFNFGDSLYEVTRTYEGILFAMDEHLNRLQNSARLALFTEPVSISFIKTLTHDTCKQFYKQYGICNLYVRITVSRGMGDLNIDRSTASRPYAIVFVKVLEDYPDTYRTQGLHYAVVTRHRNLPTALNPEMKSGNYLNNVLAIQEARALGAQDAIMLNHEGHVTEGTTNNVYIVKNGRIITAPTGVLAGITRRFVAVSCRELGVQYSEAPYSLEDVQSADEMFMSSATKEAMPIYRLSGQIERIIGNGHCGPVTASVQQAIRRTIAAYCQAHAGERISID